MEWRPIDSAPRDGTKVRLMNDEGGTHRGYFVAPCWWMIAAGVRIADEKTYRGDTDIMRAVKWRPLPPPPTGEQE